MNPNLSEIEKGSYERALAGRESPPAIAAEYGEYDSILESIDASLKVIVGIAIWFLVLSILGTLIAVIVFINRFTK